VKKTLRDVYREGLLGLILMDTMDTERRRAKREQRKAELLDMEIVSVDSDIRVEGGEVKR
jgi:hypothetical protein